MPNDLRRFAGGLPTTSDPTHVRQRIEAMEKLLEHIIRIPGTKQHFGLDVLLDLIPIGGDFIGAALGLYMVWEARNLKMSKAAMAGMIGNVAFDWLLGLIPVVGIIPDFFFRSNTRNLRTIKRHLDRHHPATVTIQH
jgi:hypothetical protein